jgi:hypothetical protein
MSAMRARALWLLTLPILLVSETLGHSGARAFDRAGERHGLVPAAVSDYVDLAHALAAVALLAGFVLAGRALAAFRRPRTRALPSWRLAAVPPGVFLLQEHLERVLHDGEIGWLTAAEPMVLAGVALQLPCGLLAVWLVRTLLRVADELGRALARRGSVRGGRPPARLWPRLQLASLGPRVLASQHAGRAPPPGR